MILTIDLDTTDPVALAAALTELAEARRQLATAQRRVQTALTNVMGLTAVPNVAVPLTAEAPPQPPLPVVPAYPLESWDRPGDPPTAADRLGEDHYVIAQESNDGPEPVKVEPVAEADLTEHAEPETSCQSVKMFSEPVAPKSAAYPPTEECLT